MYFMVIWPVKGEFKTRICSIRHVMSSYVMMSWSLQPHIYSCAMCTQAYTPKTHWYLLILSTMPWCTLLWLSVMQDMAYHVLLMCTRRSIQHTWTYSTHWHTIQHTWTYTQAHHLTHMDVHTDTPSNTHGRTHWHTIQHTWTYTHTHHPTMCCFDVSSGTGC